MIYCAEEKNAYFGDIQISVVFLSVFMVIGIFFGGGGGGPFLQVFLHYLKTLFYHEPETVVSHHLLMSALIINDLSPFLM